MVGANRRQEGEMNARGWDCTQVGQWLSKQGFEQYVDFFVEQHKIDGPTLLMLSESDLRQPPMEIPVLAHVKQLWRAIQQIQRTSSLCLNSTNTDNDIMNPGSTLMDNSADHGYDGPPQSQPQNSAFVPQSQSQNSSFVPQSQSQNSPFVSQSQSHHHQHQTAQFSPNDNINNNPNPQKPSSAVFHYNNGFNHFIDNHNKDPHNNNNNNNYYNPYHYDNNNPSHHLMIRNRNCSSTYSTDSTTQSPLLFHHPQQGSIIMNNATTTNNNNSGDNIVGNNHHNGKASLLSTPTHFEKRLIAQVEAPDTQTKSLVKTLIAFVYCSLSLLLTSFVMVIVHDRCSTCGRLPGSDALAYSSFYGLSLLFHPNNKMEKTSPRARTERSPDDDDDDGDPEDEPLMSSQMKSFGLVLAAGASDSGKRPYVVQLRRIQNGGTKFDKILRFSVPDMKTYPPLPDLFLDNVPLISWAFEVCEIIACCLMFIWLSILLLHKYKVVLMCRMFALTGTVFLLRCITMLITSLSVPGVHLECSSKEYTSIHEQLQQAFNIWLGMGLSMKGVRSCGDYMFSGHTTALTLLNHFITEYSPDSWHYLHTTTWVLNCFGIFFILAGHEHYSIDVFVAFYISSRLFLYYHSMANQHQKDERTRIWFPLFWFFESGRYGRVPNEYEWPVPSWVSMRNVLSWPFSLGSSAKDEPQQKVDSIGNECEDDGDDEVLISSYQSEKSENRVKAVTNSRRKSSTTTTSNNNSTNQKQKKSANHNRPGSSGVSNNAASGGGGSSNKNNNSNKDKKGKAQQK